LFLSGKRPPHKAEDIRASHCDICPIEASKSGDRPEMEKDRGKYCMINLDPDFPKKVLEGDFILLEIIGAGGLYPLLRELLTKGEVPLYARVPPPQ
jgi:hypothetical protein